jgi:hypothetical protein
VQYGDVDDAVVMMDHHSKRSRGFGFVTFASDAAESVMRLESHSIIFGKAVEVKPAVPREQIQGEAAWNRRRHLIMNAPALPAQTYPYSTALYQSPAVQHFYASPEQEIQALQQHLGLEVLPQPSIDWPYMFDRTVISDGAIAGDPVQWQEAHSQASPTFIRSPGLPNPSVYQSSPERPPVVIHGGVVPQASGNLAHGPGAVSAAAIGTGSTHLVPPGIAAQAMALRVHLGDTDRDPGTVPFEAIASSLGGPLSMPGPTGQW